MRTVPGGADPVVIVAWTTPIECASAIARAEHKGLFTPSEATIAFARLDDLARVWREVEPSNDVRDLARRLLRVHRLRARCHAARVGGARGRPRG